LHRGGHLLGDHLQTYPLSHSAEKNDIIDVIVCDISEEFIKGKIGHAEVMIPRSKMPQNGCEYRSNENVYIFRDEGTNEELKIDKDSKLRCRCFEIKTELSTFCPMKISR
jgi:DNA-directed RNA polymerase subunit E'/Rpb7